MHDLWVERYRPKTLSDYVWKDERQKEQVEAWLEEGIFSHVLLYGPPGTGKSSFINMLLNEFNIDSNDLCYINTPEENSVEVVRNKILNFASTIPWGRFKVIVLEEYSGVVSKSAQEALKRIMEDYSDQCRFLLTTNHYHTVNPAIVSRCHCIHMKSLNEDEFALKMASILDENKINYEVDVLIDYIKGSIPDLRKAISLIQMNSKNGTLKPMSDDVKSTQDYMVKVTELFRKNKIEDARKCLIENASYEDYNEIYRYLYRNLDIWSNDTDKQDQALIIIRDGLYKDSIVADREINLSATLAQLKLLERE